MARPEDEAASPQPIASSSPPIIDPPAQGLDIEDILYSASSFWAVLKPVALTMFLASLVVVNIDFNGGQDDQGLSIYTVDTGEGGDSNSVKLGKSLVNALTIVGTICGATFIVVLLYKFRCMKILVGYMALSCILLLGFMGGVLWETALIKYDLPCDFVTFILVIYNFAVVGVISIFYQKGIPMIVTQAYLVMISVIMAWQLSRFEEWTGWCLLVILALYDLCAVLTPCGPLRCLVGLMQEYNEPMPGLLYEAELPSHAAHHRHPRPQSTRTFPVSSPGEGGRGGDSGGAETQGRTTGTRGTVVMGNITPGPQDPLLDGQNQETQTQPPEARPLTDPDSTSLDGGGAGNRTEGVDGGVSPRESEHEGHTRNNIKLGLGDFVFYSVLVSKAALYGFATCAACFLVIISGLGGTLLLLSVFRKALPALPISIGLGVTFYLLTRVVIIPYLDELIKLGPIYV